MCIRDSNNRKKNKKKKKKEKKKEKKKKNVNWNKNVHVVIIPNLKQYTRTEKLIHIIHLMIIQR